MFYRGRRRSREPSSRFHRVRRFSSRSRPLCHVSDGHYFPFLLQNGLPSYFSFSENPSHLAPVELRRHPPAPPHVRDPTPASPLSSLDLQGQGHLDLHRLLRRRQSWTGRKRNPQPAYPRRGQSPTPHPFCRSAPKLRPLTLFCPLQRSRIASPLPTNPSPSPFVFRSLPPFPAGTLQLQAELRADPT